MLKTKWVENREKYFLFLGKYANTLKTILNKGTNLNNQRNSEEFSSITEMKLCGLLRAYRNNNK